MTETASPTYTVTAPSLVGAYLYDPTDPEGTERHFLHVDARSDSVEPDATALPVAGRVNPVVEFGEQIGVTIKATVTIPFGTTAEGYTHDQQVDWWRTAARNRRTICYRDNRSRKVFGALVNGAVPTDTRTGTTIALNLRQVDYSESVV